MTQEPVRNEYWYAERNTSFEKIRQILANVKTRRLGKRSILQQNIDEIRTLNQEFAKKSEPQLARTEKITVAETENPGW